MEIIEGKLIEAQKVVIYGPEGIGKSTLHLNFRILYLLIQREAQDTLM